MQNFSFPFNFVNYFLRHLLTIKLEVLPSECSCVDKLNMGYFVFVVSQISVIIMNMMEEENK
jgi:hypothetical protein